MESQAKMILVACGGLEKPEGSVSRQIAYNILKNFNAEEIQIVALPQLCAGVSPCPL